jgi:hypothetical protein
LALVSHRTSTRFESRRALATAALLLLAAIAPLGAQAVLTIPPTSTAYERLDALASLGLLDGFIVGQRPISEARAAALYTSAAAKLSTLTPDHRQVAARLLADLRSEIRIAADTDGVTRPKPIRLIERLDAEVVHLDSPDRAVVGDGLGGISARINPLVSGANGRRYSSGWTTAFESLHELSLFDHVGLAVRPRVTSTRDTLGAQQWTAQLQAAYGTLRARNTVVEIGRDYVRFGSGIHGSVLVSDNAPALDMIRVGSVQPFILPGFLRALGPTAANLFVADLGKNQNHPHDQLIGYMVSFLPSPRFEWGVQVIDQMGGQGGPHSTFADRVADLTVLYDPLFLKKNDIAISNKLAGVDLTYRSPSNCFSVYGSGALDDADYRRWRSMFTQDAGYVLGASASCIAAPHAISVTTEFHSTGIRYYEHPQYSSGVTSNETLIGDELGPRAHAGLVRFDALQASGADITLDATVEVRSGNTYRIRNTDANYDNFGFALVSSRPPEQRQRAILQWSSPRKEGVRFSARAGAERVANFDFVPGTRFNSMAGVQLDYRF